MLFVYLIDLRTPGFIFLANLTFTFFLTNTSFEGYIPFKASPLFVTATRVIDAITDEIAKISVCSRLQSALSVSHLAARICTNRVTVRGI